MPNETSWKWTENGNGIGWFWQSITNRHKPTQTPTPTSNHYNYRRTINVRAKTFSTTFRACNSFFQRPTLIDITLLPRLYTTISNGCEAQSTMLFDQRPPIQPNSHSPVKLHKWYYSANFLVFDWSINATNFNFSIRFSTTGICIFHSFRRIWWIMAYAINQNLH